MARRFVMERQTALLAEEAGEAVNAMVRWGLAAQASRDALERLEALSAARRQAELAFHQAVWAAVWARPKRHPWREIAPLTGMPWQTLYRRYREPPERFPRGRGLLDEQTLTQLIQGTRAADPLHNDRHSPSLPSTHRER